VRIVLVLIATAVGFVVGGCLGLLLPDALATIYDWAGGDPAAIRVEGHAGGAVVMVGAFLGACVGGAFTAVWIFVTKGYERDVRSASWLRPPRRDPERSAGVEERERCMSAARKAFRVAFPAREIRDVEIRSIFRHHIIITLYHCGVGRPTPREYIRVRRSDHATRIEPWSRWWPRSVK